MLLFASPTILPHFEDDEKFVIYNFSSFSNAYPQLFLFPPNEAMGNVWQNELDFDSWYFNWVVMNDVPFLELMKIVYPIYVGMNVLVLVNWFERMDYYFYANLNESLMKLIQVRYGYASSVINTIEDYYMMDSYRLDSHFNQLGLQFLDGDKSRMAALLQGNWMQNRQEIIIPGFKYAEDVDGRRV